MRTVLGLIVTVMLAIACGSNDPKGSTQPGTGGENPGGGNGGTGGGNGGGGTTTVRKLNGAEYDILAGTPSSVSDTAIAGEVTIRFRQARLSEDSNYELIFTLPEVGSSLTLVANANDALNNGVSVIFTHKPDGKLGLSIKTNQDPNLDMTDQLNGLAATGTLSFPVDVHAHGDAIVDLPGGDLAGEGFNLRPVGRHYGLILNKAAVTKANATDPKHPHSRR